MTDLTSAELDRACREDVGGGVAPDALSPAHDLGAVLAEEARVIGIEGLVPTLSTMSRSGCAGSRSSCRGARRPVRPGHGGGRAFATSSVVEVEVEVEVEADGGHGRRMWLPLLDGTERLGAMELTFPPRAASSRRRS